MVGKSCESLISAESRTHDHGELDCKSRRITLLLDLAATYRRLKARGNWIYRYLIARWPDVLHRRFAT